ALLVPGILTLVARVGARPLGLLFGIEGRLAHANLAGAIPRLAVSVAALAVSLSMMVAIAIMIGSFRETVIYWVGQTLQADLFIAPASRGRGLDDTLSADVQRLVRAHPDVAAVDEYRSLEMPYGDTRIRVGARDFTVFLAHGSLLFKS